MPQDKRGQFTDDQIREAYKKAGSLEAMAKDLNISYPTAAAWTTELGIAKKRRGYTPPDHEITGNQCRHAREYLRMTRDDFCEAAGTGKTAIRQFELGNSTPRRETLQKILDLFESHNIAFQTDGTFRDES